MAKDHEPSLKDTSLSADHNSYWAKSAQAERRPPLDGASECDVAVIGGGIVGVTTALELARAGADVVLLEARRIGSGATGFTTAKLSSLHGLTYAGLESSFDEETARAYGAANEAGLERVAREVEALAIECDFRRKPNFTYAASEGGREDVAEEARVAAGLDLPASLDDGIPELPFEVAGAVRFADQAEFHPLRYLHAIAAAATDAGSRVYEASRVVSVDQGDPCEVTTEGGAAVRCGHVVVATHLPILDRGLYFARSHPERSYVLLAKLRSAVPQGMYLSDESPAHSLRSVPTDDGELLMAGGESHKTGQSDTAERYAALERWTREHFDVASIEHRWATQDHMPADGLPMIGRLWPFSDRLLTATALRKWGLAIGAEAGAILTDLVLGRENAWAQTFDPMRLGPPATAAELAKENANVAARFVGDRITHRGNPRCTHLGCLLDWNTAERTWDCPCHGSRFGAGGEVLEGPAVKPLSLD